MNKKVAIIGAGISGLVFANFLKKNSKYKFTIYEKNSSLDLTSGYGIQLSTNSVSILNNINFSELKTNNRFHPEKIDFYSLNKNTKIRGLVARLFPLPAGPIHLHARPVSPLFLPSENPFLRKKRLKPF